MLKKLTSRKFIVAVAMVIVLFFISDDKTMTEACATLISTVYMLSEAIVDRSRAVKREIRDNASVTKYVNEETENENQQ